MQDINEQERKSDAGFEDTQQQGSSASHSPASSSNSIPNQGSSPTPSSLSQPSAASDQDTSITATSPLSSGEDLAIDSSDADLTSDELSALTPEGRPVERRSGARGTAAMDAGTRREVARKGGLAVSRNRQHMSEIGRKGGQSVSKNREHMAKIGRKGGAASRGHHS